MYIQVYIYIYTYIEILACIYLYNIFTIVYKICIYVSHLTYVGLLVYLCMAGGSSGKNIVNG